MRRGGRGRRSGLTITAEARWIKFITVILLIAFFHLTIAPSVSAQEEPVVHEERAESTGTQFGLGLASFFLTLPYGAAKVAYALLGGIVGGCTYALTAGNSKAANAVWNTSLRGTYVISPEHLRGEKTVRFFGVPREQPEAPPEPAAPEPAPAGNP